ncbi:MAG: (Fe-S)-binding protein [Desulfitobacterium sp.]|nr:(Fe-S)-binding protein [Desulfitobacterium sp.]
MSYKENGEEIIQKIQDECLSCGQCISECQLLQSIGEDVVEIAERLLSPKEAFSCSLCGLCEGVCPLGLSPRDMFQFMRKKAVAEGTYPIHDYKYMFPDRPLNVMKAYRQVYGVDYQELNPDREGEVAFFPGCTMLTYNPDLIFTSMDYLRKEYKDVTLLTDCCGLPLWQLGLKERWENFTQDLKEKLLKLNVKKVILACSNCYYQLQLLAKELGITLLTIYEALEDSEAFNTPIMKEKILTVHDSCPDRFQGIFAKQTRQALEKKGYQVVEMEHHHEKALCCGSGGQVTHAAPSLAQELVETRLGEVEETNAQILTAYCLGCVLNLSKNQDSIPVQHVLNLLLDFEQEYVGLKKRTQTLFDGPEGEKLWEKVMQD